MLSRNYAEDKRTQQEETEETEIFQVSIASPKTVRASRIGDPTRSP